MNKEPIGLYIFRFVLGFGLFALMGMLYWSSLLVENNLSEIRKELAEIKNDIFTLRLEGEKQRNDLLNDLKKECQQAAQSAHKAANGLQDATPISSNDKIVKESNTYPNLLLPDPFYTDTLPKLLGTSFNPVGTQHLSSVGKPDNLHPFSNWSQVVSWHDLCTVTAARLAFGKYETFAPEMAQRIEERINAATGRPEFWIFLRNDVYWEPLKPDYFAFPIYLAPQFLRKNQVTAEDFKFYYDAMMNPYMQEPGAVSLRTYYSAIESVEVIDKFTLVVRWKTRQVPDAKGKESPQIKYIAKLLTGGLKPLPCFVYKYFADGKKIIEDDDKDPQTYRTNSIWAQNFSTHWAKNIIVSCGAWIFQGMTDKQIKFSRNPNFFFPLGALTGSIEIDFKESPDNVWQAFKNEALDSINLQPNELTEFQTFLQSDIYKKQAQKGLSIHRLDFLSRSYAYIAWNETKPFFNNAKMRRAMTMAIDRQRIIEQTLNGQGVEIHGTFFVNSKANNPSIVPWPFSPQQARRLLEEEGWIDTDGDGIVDKLIDGKRTPFSFFLTYYVKNPISKAICEYVSIALKDIGVECKLHGVDVADLSATFDDKNFDALNLAWGLGTPPDDPRQLWHSSGAKEKGSSNAIGFANAEIDSIIDKLDYEHDAERRIALYHRFDAIIHDEQPYTFLYTPKVAFIYRDYLQNVFIPAERQDLVPGADIAEPNSAIYWLLRRDA